jgi:hypothetical protein
LRMRERNLRERLQESNQDLGMARQESSPEAVKGIKQRIQGMSEQLIQIQRALAQRPIQS